MKLRLMLLFFKPRNIEASYYYIKALKLLVKKRIEDSIKYFFKVLNISKEVNFITYSCNKYLGIAHCFKEDYMNAKKYLELASRLKPKKDSDYELLAFLGLIYKIEGKFQKAIEFFLKALASEKPKFYMFTKDSFIHLSLGYSYYQLGIIQKAINHYEEFLALAKSKDEENDKKEVKQFLRSLKGKGV